METQPKSLAEFLGVPHPARPAEPVEPVDTSKLSARTISRELLNSREYKDALLRRIILDELPPAVECKLWDYAYGKPVERVEIKDTTSPKTLMTAAELEERAAALGAMAAELRLIEHARVEPAAEEMGVVH